jgi:hypothetical protein
MKVSKEQISSGLLTKGVPVSAILYSELVATLQTAWKTFDLEFLICWASSSLPKRMTEPMAVRGVDRMATATSVTSGDNLHYAIERCVVNAFVGVAQFVFSLFLKLGSNRFVGR